MEPITIVSKNVSEYIAGKLMDRIISRFQAHVIQRWTKYRSEIFFKAFCEEVSANLSSSNSDNVDILLDMIVGDDGLSEVLFDSYRRVCMARSKNLGPRIIGILTAKIISEKRLASEIEEMIFMAAEQLNDDELLSFVSFYEENKMVAESEERKKDARFNKSGDLEIKWAEESIDSNWSRNSTISLSPLNLAECLGTWALKLKSLGFIADDVKERQWDYEADLERHRDEAGTVREVSWWIQIPFSSVTLVDLINRAS